MTRTTALGVFVLALAVVFLTASVPGAFAQDPKGGGGAGGAGASAPRGGGGDAGGGARGGGVSSAPAPSSSGSSGGGPVFSGGGGMSGGSSSGMSAVPRGANRGNENAGGRDRGVASPRYGGGAAAGGYEGRVSDAGAYRRSPTDDQMAGRSRTGAASSGAESSMPWYSRPRGGNPSTGTAVTRPDVPANGLPGGGGGYYPGYPGYPWYPGYGGGYYDCYYRPYACNAYWGYGYGAFGLGYFYFDPFGWNYGDYAYWGGGGGGGGTYGGQQMGSIRLKVKPSNAAVFVDGYYAGTVDDFDNAFQKLSVALGTHRIEISAPGYRPLVFELEVRDFDTINYEGRLEPIR